MIRVHHSPLCNASRGLLNWASAVWAVKVLAHEGATKGTAYREFTEIVPENWLAITVLTIDGTLAA